MVIAAPVRIGTQERERTVESLGEHYSAGRLDLAEYEQRTSTAWAARTAVDLSVLFEDLPQRTPEPARTWQPGPRRSRLLFALLVLGVVALTAFWAATTHLPPFFLIPVAFVALGRRNWGSGWRRGQPRAW